MTIERPEKIGLGTWDKDALGSALNDVDRVGFDWHYNWSERTLWDADATPDLSSHVAMIWDEQDVTAQALATAQATGATTLLGFNEPNETHQANMSVEQALALWPQLQATGLRLGSPAASQHQTLGADSWLGRFMAGAEAQGLRVDFIAVHYYSKTESVAEFKTYLEAVHAQYGKPVWVTEWALADWSNQNRFTANQQAAFARAGTEMMDDLPFVERQAWFAAYEGGDGWHIRSGLIDALGQLTVVGQTFTELVNPGSNTPTETPTTGNLLKNGSFEEASVTTGQYASFSAVPGWTAIGGGSIELWNAHRGVNASHGTDFAELDYRSGLDGFQQSVQTKAGQTYDLSFDKMSRPGSTAATTSVEVLWNDKLVATVAPGASWSSTNLQMTGTGAMDELTIREVHSQSGDGYGAMLDNFKLVASGTSSAPIPTPTADDIITVRARGDYYKGDPNFSISVDGKVIDSTNLVTADRVDNEWQTFTFTGDFDVGGTQAHRVGIEFTNDAWGGTSTTDRNLYIDAVTFNGVTNTTDATYEKNAMKYWDFNV